MTEADKSRIRLIDALSELKVHDHICLIYKDRREQLAAAIPFVRLGLDRGERCMYVVDENTTVDILEAMRADSIDVDSAVKSGALIMAGKTDTYLREGKFDPDAMIEFFEETAEAAKVDGFSVLRLAGEMTWALGPEPGVQRLVEYEIKLNQFFAEHDALAICQYNQNRFQADIMLNIIRTHPKIIFATTICDNPIYIPPEEILEPKPENELNRMLNTMVKQHKSEMALQEAGEAKLKALYKCIPVPTYSWRKTGEDFVLVDYNNAAEAITHGKVSTLIGKKASDIYLNKKEVVDDLKRCFDEKRTIRREMLYEFMTTGETKHLDVSYAFVPPDLVMVGTEDITGRKQAEKEIQRMAFHDPLTNLPNRRLLKDHLDQALASAKRNQRMVALLFIDLDHFKHINDVFGHDAGDAVLKTVAKRLKKCIRAADTAARIGGDEFTVLAVGLETKAAVTIVAEKILGALSQPFLVHDHRLFINATIGLSVYPNDGTDAKILLRNADASLHRAKNQGGGIYQFFTPKIHKDAVERMAMENSLRRSIEKEEMTVYYQPCVDLRTQEIIGMEALTRWNHPERGFLHPDNFIPLAEETGLILPLGEQVLRMACVQNKAWIDSGLRAGPVMVNISNRQFCERDLVEKIGRILKETGLDPSDLNLEITENLLIDKLEQVSLGLYELKEMGVGIIMDDFGVGYSSLSSLRLFPVDTLKIDRLFIQDVTTNPDDAAIVRAILSMARALGQRIIAEGVEKKEQLAFLRSLNCEAMQGFLFSRPITAREFTKLLQERPRLPEAA